MLSFIKKLFGTKPTVNPCSDVPYKVEAPTIKDAPGTKAKKSVVKKATTRKPKTPKA